MMLTRHGRHLFLLVALLFHLGTATLFAIDFSTLWLCYGVLLGFPGASGTTEVDRPWRGPALVCAAVLVGAVSTGVSGQTQAWPFACYPTFATPVPDTMPVLAVRADGELVPTSDIVSASASQQHISEAWGLLGLYGPVQPGAHTSFCARVRARLPDAEVIVLYSARTSIDPDAPGLTVGPLLHRCVSPPRTASPESAR